MSVISSVRLRKKQQRRPGRPPKRLRTKRLRPPESREAYKRLVWHLPRTILLTSAEISTRTLGRSLIEEM